MNIRDNVRNILSEIPKGVLLVAATKAQSPEKIAEAVLSGVDAIGENYVQEGEKKFAKVNELISGKKVQRHFIGHLQKNKVKKALSLFDVIETVDSIELAEEIDRRAVKKVPVLIEVNISGEETKTGIKEEDAEKLARNISALPNIELSGLMAIPYSDDREKLRGYFREMKILFERLKELKIPGADLKFLSMGMSSDYDIAVEEGANIIRVGTKIFGERKK
ncbi:MAG: YggS family pyridoxal phosphate-dependent enzyme [Candidatus Woesearchaeota archaeon]|nr:YggS family pyridoxal phosphate-dependent enzyme [Candidatus Woesearchaeota archaeon]